MTETEVIIVGAGPAGSSCAGFLKKKGVGYLLFDRQPFPRNKVCAGWITPEVFQALSLSPDQYPYGLKLLDKFVIHLRRKSFTLPVKQFAIRRVEFDAWLLEINGVHPILHEVKKVEMQDGFFLVDDEFRCRYLVGAGGDRCPVASKFFRNDRQKTNENLVVAVEKEFRYPVADERCHLWFHQKGLPGYAWYLPKADGYLNIGLGAFFQELILAGISLKEKWQEFLETLRLCGLYSGEYLQGDGYSYRIRSGKPLLQKRSVFLAGDAAGLATVDMGEGIGPAVESGLETANALISGKSMRLSGIRNKSFSWTGWMWQIISGHVRREKPLRSIVLLIRLLNSKLMLRIIPWYA